MTDDEHGLPQVTLLPPTVKLAGDPRGKQATWTLRSAPPGVCSQCAVDHVPETAHNQQSLHWQYAFYAEHDRWPTWHDAMRHCTPEMKEFWLERLAEHGVEVGPDEHADDH